MKKQLFIAFLLSAFLFYCGKDDLPDGVVNIPSGKGHDLLSDYHFFEGNLAQFITNQEATILPYDLNMPLFSDYALKKRFIYIPDGGIIPYETNKTLELPVGSVLIKHFYYNLSNGGELQVETRLLIKRNDGWQAETYEWNESQTNATRSVLGGTKALTVFANGATQTIDYQIPNVNQCKNCHNYNGKIEPIGPQIENLNKDYPYESGTENQIEKWISAGILANHSGSVPHWPKLDDLNADLNEKARAYLAINCASCHRLAGSAANSGLYLSYENTDSLSLGFYKSPVAAGGGSGGYSYVIDPGNADQSILLYRMISNEIDERMPEIGRSVSHDEGIQLIEDWINSL